MLGVLVICDRVLVRITLTVLLNVDFVVGPDTCVFGMIRENDQHYQVVLVLSKLFSTFKLYYMYDYYRHNTNILMPLPLQIDLQVVHGLPWLWVFQ